MKCRVLWHFSSGSSLFAKLHVKGVHSLQMVNEQCIIFVKGKSLYYTFAIFDA